MKGLIAIFLVLALLLAAGCSKQVQQPEQKETSGDESSISSDVNDALQESDELDFDSVDGIDKDLEDFSW